MLLTPAARYPRPAYPGNKTGEMIGTEHDELDRIATGSAAPRFGEIVSRRLGEIGDRLNGRRVCVLGGAGSIGGRFAMDLLGFAPAEVLVCDKNENGLTDLTRDMRADPRSRAFGGKLEFFCLDVASPEMADFLAAHGPEVILNFAALKHVRTEKHLHSVRYMLRTNVMALRAIIADGALARARTLFSISTDKAASPANVMGASKRLGEYVMGHGKAVHPDVFISSTRFANVAYSNGSILQSIVTRLRERQVFGVPARIRRYFISQAEASQICLLSLLGEFDGGISIPREDLLAPDVPILDLARSIVARHGYDPVEMRDEDEARSALPGMVASGRYPIVVTGGDTVGEKPQEVFHADFETAEPTREPALLRVPFPELPDWGRFDAALAACLDAGDMDDVLDAMGGIMPEFHHLGSHRHLDQGI